MLLQGTRPRSASDTLMSRRNIPASPLPLFPSPGRWSSGCGSSAGAKRGRSAWKECARRRGRNTRVRYRRQLAKNEYWVQGIAVVPQGRQCAFRELIETGLVVAPCERTAQLYLPEATSGCPSSARAGAPVGAKEVYSAPASPPHKRGMHPVRHLKSLKNVQLTTQLC